MYICAAHNWVSFESMCPICSPQGVVSASTRQPIPLYHDNNDFLRPIYSQKEVQDLCTKAMVMSEGLIRMINTEKKWDDAHRKLAIYKLQEIRNILADISAKNDFTPNT